MKNRGIGILALGFGVVSIFCSFFPKLWWGSIILAISGLTLGIVLKIKVNQLKVERVGNGLVNAGIVFNIITIVLNTIAYLSSRLFLGVIS